MPRCFYLLGETRALKAVYFWKWVHALHSNEIVVASCVNSDLKINNPKVVLKSTLVLKKQGRLTILKFFFNFFINSLYEMRLDYLPSKVPLQPLLIWVLTLRWSNFLKMESDLLISVPGSVPGYRKSVFILHFLTSEILKKMNGQK